MKTSALLLAGALFAGVGLSAVLGWGPHDFPDDLPEMRALPAGVVAYRPAGEFRKGSRVLDAPKRDVAIADNLEIMRYPVTQAAFSACVRDRGCSKTHSAGSNELPQTLVSYRDALDFAAWQSRRTGQTWRLPSGPEWAAAASERYVDEVLEDTPEASDDPAQRWLQAYQATARQRDDADPTLRPLGTYGDNALGIGYMGSNTWDWTTTCLQKGEVTEQGELLRYKEDYCGVRLAQGIHRAFIIDFVRDASVGGCAVGLPPDHLTIRLVREK